MNPVDAFQEAVKVISGFISHYNRQYKENFYFLTMGFEVIVQVLFE